MDAFLLVAIVLVLGLAVAPMFLMRGQWGKKKDKAGSDGADVVTLSAGLGSGGGKTKGHDPDTGSTGGSDGGSDGGGGGGE
jgi:hypothetical protein